MNERSAASPVEGAVSDARDATGFSSDGLAHAAIYDVEASDPRSSLIDRSGVAPEDLRQIAALMGAIGELRDAEQKLSLASRRYMRLNDTDMRALHYLIVCANKGVTATPGGIATHLGISTASTTKLLDRLERGGHIRRAPHPTDRRALAITISPETRQAAMDTVGAQQAKRFYSAARLTREERDVVIRFLADMTQEITLRDEPWAQTGDVVSD
ncbi:MarR family winged helix-turn-helix transcriptional regulator [Microbacterium hydrocarbonoxydans]|uniref:MarR family winged helix-turn-helix transcriptional regulator n=1 Tax=Microbacterium hydrocarbonoxydans TaxID=273678 RepID=UPI00204207C9|nr:MarR family transcriptional regulator [Microbacterium hydrocarbonoxydans]MCM3780095.1 MarR family transcriptional regulator [Microbacterium hydrocarbonoxydans]